MELDCVRIGASELEDARLVYGLMLGVAAAPIPEGWRLALARGAVELVDDGPAGLYALGFAAGGDWPEDFHGLDIRRVERRAEPELAGVAASEGIDHVVVHTVHPERAIRLWRDTVGLRLALDRTFPSRGLRLLFFRTGGITLEYACPLDATADPGAPDRLYGVSYRVAELALRRLRLLDAGLDVSEIRPGMKPGTQVATVRSRTAGVPTLLIEPAPR
jgi:catechol 2,3-dioxygenase-like lactoylglutathione lyase family enzyme